MSMAIDNKPKEFITTLELLGRLNKRLFRGYNNFCMYEVFQEMKTIKVVGVRKVKENLKVLNKHKEFFVPTVDAHFGIAIVELAKFFDKDSKALSIMHIIKYIADNQGKLTIKEFREYDINRPMLDELLGSYKGITKECLDSCNRDLVRVGLSIEAGKSDSGQIERLKTLRNKYIAHDQIEKVNIELTPAEIRGLFEVAGNIINKLSHALNHSICWHNHDEALVKDSVKNIIKKLK